MGAEWLDWAKLYTARGYDIAEPANEDELISLISKAKRPIRPRGAGHSFSALVADGSTVVSLDAISGIESVDRHRMVARVRAGSRLRDLTRALHEERLAFRNLGDIDEQSIAGAIATATHGTGADLQCLSAEVAGARIVTATGAIVDIDESRNADLLGAVQVSLGALGILTHVDLKVVDAHRLHRRTWSQGINSVLVEAEERWKEHRNFEFFYIPFSGHALCVSHDLTIEDVRHGKKGDDDAGVHDLRRARDFLGWWPALREWIIRRELARFPTEDAIDYNWRLLASKRNVVFREMEYHLPVDCALDVLREITYRIETRRPDVFFPIEVRKTAGDSAWLSPFNGAPRISIAVHAWEKDDYRFLHDLVEPLFLEAGGRPHWGKLHAIDRDRLDDMYPMFSRFETLRRSMDPDGVFLNPFLKKLFRQS